MKILVVDDQSEIIRSISSILAPAEVIGASDGSAALKALAKDNTIKIVFLDVMLGDDDGLEILQKIKKQYPDIICIMISGYATIEKAVLAVKLGAFDFLEKPLSPGKLRIIIKNVKERSRLEAIVEREIDRYRIIGISRAIEQLNEQILKASTNDFPVLINGPSGSGKENTANLIHLLSLRAQKKMIKINCAAIPQNLFESELFGHSKGAFTGALYERKGKIIEADGGSLYLDEITELPKAQQSKFLRVLEDKIVTPVGKEDTRQVDFRLICATNKSLKKAVEKGAFREDLFYRLNVIVLTIPPLNERREDIPLLAKHFLELAAREGGAAEKTFDDKALELISHLPFDGNVRELKHMIQQLAIFSSGDVITKEDIDNLQNINRPVNELKMHEAAFDQTMPFSRAQDMLERKYIERQLELHNGNLSRTAKDLGVLPQNLQRKMRQLKIIRRD